MAREGAAGQDGPGRRPQLPHGHVGALLRHRAAGGDLVREGRPQLDRHAQLHPPAVGRRCRRAGSRRATGRSSGRSPKKFSELAAKHFPEPVDGRRGRRRSRTTRRPRSRSPRCKDWITRRGRGDSRARRCRRSRWSTRDYANLYNQFISFGPLVRDERAGRARHALRSRRRLRRGGARPARRRRGAASATRRSRDDEEVCNIILQLRHGDQRRAGLPLVQEHGGEGRPAAGAPGREGPRDAASSYKDLQAQPRRFINSPMWSGLIENGRAYSPFTYNVEALVPWRTLTGRQHFYLDHPGYLQFGEHLPTYKPKPLPTQYADLRVQRGGRARRMMLNYLTPHGKWHIHSTYGDNQRMTTLSRGVRAVLDERPGRRRDRHRGQRLGRGAQRPRRRGDAGGRQRPHSARHLHPVPLAGAHLLGAEVAAARQPPRRRPQQPDAHAAEAEPDGRRLRAVHLPLQLLGPDRAATATRTSWCASCPS